MQVKGTPEGVVLKKAWKFLREGSRLVSGGPCLWCGEPRASSAGVPSVYEPWGLDVRDTPAFGSTPAAQLTLERLLVTLEDTAEGARTWPRAPRA